jgi:hypothetical protein
LLDADSDFSWAEGRDERFATPPSIAAKKATAVIPIVVAAAGDPVGTGLVASLARPGGNVTGLSIQQTDLAASASNCCARFSPVSARAFDALKGRADAVYVCSLPLLTTNRIRVNNLALAILVNIGSPNSVAGNGRGSGGGPHGRPRCGHIGGSESRGYCRCNLGFMCVRVVSANWLGGSQTRDPHDWT